MKNIETQGIFLTEKSTVEPVGRLIGVLYSGDD